MSTIYPFYNRKTVEEEARAWLIRLDGDAPLSEKEQEQLKEWSQRSQEHQQELQRISEFFEEANVLVELAVPMNKGRGLRKTWPRLLVNFLAGFNIPQYIAVAFVGAVFISLIVLSRQYQIDRLSEDNGLYATPIGEILEQELNDGSVLHINTNSQVDIDFSPVIRKVRLLKGEAHFTVAKDNDWPFEVYAGNKIVKAVGTAFTVRLEGQGLQVTVTEGKVDLIKLIDKLELPEPGPKQNLNASIPQKVASLEQGQQANFYMDTANPNDSTHSEKLTISAITNVQIEKNDAWHTGYLFFAGDSLADVVAEISRYSNTRIEISSPELRNLRIGGRFKVNDLDALFEVLETNMGVQVTRLDDKHIRFHTLEK